MAEAYWLSDMEELLELLGDLQATGSAAFREAIATRQVSLDDVIAHLDKEGRDLINRYEEESSQEALALAQEHFALGYAIGSSGLLDQLARMGLVGQE